jgi:hypothetical protein
MAIFDEKIFWRSKTATSPFEFATQWERLNTYIDTAKFNRVLVTNNGNVKPSGMSLIDFLKIKRDNVWSEAIARFPGNIDEQQAYANEVGILSDEELATFANITQNEVPKKALELYFNAYMAPAQSDIQWRLGQVTGMYMGSEADTGMEGIIDNKGRIYTRTNFNQSLKVKFWNGEMGTGISEANQYYANLFFPPYKIGTDYKIEDKTYIMDDGTLPIDATFDQDAFMLKRDGFTYRDPGFKAVNDNINFLQWCLERATGLVSTYLTEWDLSVYMQEHMIAAEPNAGPMKLWLNFRVKQDNPLATEKQGYTTDRAYCFSVLNSAVSKIDFDCLKYWRPSDYPLSPYWMPYVKGYDWDIKFAEIHDDDIGTQEKIPYMSVYDENPIFSYNRKNLKDIIKHEDYIQISNSGWKNMDMQYYQVLYSIENESLSEYDLKLKKYIDKVAGCDFGKSGRYDLSHLKADSWSDMIASGGYIGADAPAGMGGAGGASGAKSKKAQFLKWMINGGSHDEDDGSDMIQQLNQGKQDAASYASDMLGPSPQATNGKVSAADIQEARRKQASTMGKYVGINRLSPALFGGPHGSSYSPLTIQGYFDTYNKALRNTPRISPHTAQDFTSDFKYDLYEGNNAFYYNSTPNSCSPSKSLGYMKKGVYSWVPAYARFKVQTTKLIKGEIKYRSIGWRGQLYYDFPTQIGGFTVYYSGDYVWESVTEFKIDGLWHENSNDWWNNYYSYYDDYCIRKRAHQNGLWGWLTTTQNIYRTGTFYEYVTRPYKKYLLHDEPDVKWSITTHKVLKYETDGSWNGPYWKLLRGLFDRINIRRKYIMYVSQDTLYKLNIEDSAAEQRVREYMIQAGRGENPRAPLFFCQGNIEGRYTQGPESIFQANCRIEQYVTETQVMVPRLVWNTIDSPFWNAFRIFLRIPHIIYEYKTVYGYVPYIAVELNDADLLFWADKLHTRPYNNEWKGSVEKPLQFESVPKFEEIISPDDDPLVKFRGNHNYKFSSGYEEEYTEVITRQILTLPSGEVNYPNPEWLYPPVRRRTGKSIIPVQTVPIGPGNNPVASSELLGMPEVKFRNLPPRVEIENNKLESQIIDKTNCWICKDYTVDSSKYAEGELDVITEYLRYPDDYYVKDLRGKYLLDAGKKVPYYMEVVYERKDNADIEVMDADWLHPKAHDTDTANYQQTYIPGPGTITKSVRYYAHDIPSGWWDTKDVSKLLGGGHYKIEYYPHIKSAQDVSREKDLRALPGFSDYVWPSDLFSGGEKTRGHYNWRSIGTAGIKGIGLLGKIPGIEPNVEDTEFEEFSKWLCIDPKIYMNVPMSKIPWKTHKVSTTNVKKGLTTEGIEWTLPGGSFDYNEFDMDDGLKNAISTMASRATFFRVDAPSIPALIDLSVPFRVLLNICLTQQSFINLLKEVLLDSVDFETLYQMVDDCVDKSVSKANGFYIPEDPDEEAKGDPNHILYDYWLDNIIKILRDKTQHAKNRELVERDFADKLGKLQYAIDILTPMSKTWAKDWTWKQILDGYDVLQILKDSANELTYVEKYIMGYIHILYNYRLFFICKRFNKQDGTMWTMRALESILNFVAPYNTDDNPPPSPMKMMKKEPAYKVAFVEFQNTFSMKQHAIVYNEQLDQDRVRVCYVKVEWGTRKQYLAYEAWKKDPVNNPESIEVVKIYHKGKIKYAKKPIDGTYSLISKEILDNEKNIKWNNTHQEEPQRPIEGYDIANWWIDWGDSPDLTPIRWNVFINLDPDKLIEYCEGNISPEELICLAEVGSDFWTVTVPESIWPKAYGLKTKVKLKHYDPIQPIQSLRGDAYVAILGSQAYTLWPITEKQDAPNPAVIVTPDQKTDLAKSVKSYI